MDLGLFDDEPAVPAAPKTAEPPAATGGKSLLDMLAARIPPQPWEHKSLSPEIAKFVETFYKRGFRLLTFEERASLFVTPISTLTPEDDELLKKHRKVLLDTCAEVWSKEDEALRPVRVEMGASLSQLRGAASERDWRPSAPPVLSGIDEIILNYETNGLKWYAGHRPIGVTVGTMDGQLKQFMPFAFQGGGTNLDEETVRRWAKEQLRGKRIVNINTRFDVHMSREWGIDLEEQGNTVSDVSHWAALLDDHRKRFSIDVLAKDYLGGIEIDRVDEANMADYATYQVAPRAEYQAQLIAQLSDAMWPELGKQDLHRVRGLEDDVIFATCEMEKNGAPIDMELLDEYHKRCAKKHQELLWEVVQECGFAFDHTNAMWQRLFEHCHVPLKVLESGEKHSFAEAFLVSVKHPLIQKAHLAGQYGSLDSKTFAAYKRIIGDDGILHFDLNQLRGEDGGTVSGRYSCGYIQQVPNAANHFEVFGDDLFPRRLYIPGKGYKYLAADAAQIEYRIFASLAKNKQVLEAYAKDPTTSFHKMVWNMILPYKPDMLYPHQKSMNFMILYGGGLIKIAMMMGMITPEEAEEIKDAKSKYTDPRLAVAREIEAIYNKVMPEVKPLTNWASHLAAPKCDKYCRKSDELHRKYEHQGYVQTITGRRSRFPNGYKLYIALNRIVSGTAADVNKRKLVELNRTKKETGFLLRMTVHDEVCGSAPDEECKRKVMEILNVQSFPEMVVPILWEGELGNNWAECK